MKTRSWPRSATGLAATTALIAAVAAACGTVLDIGDDEAPPPVGAEGGNPDVDVDARGVETDAAAQPDVGELLPGTDGAADDGAPISPDASLDGYSPPGCPGAISCTRVVFVTSMPVNSLVVGANADSQCQSRADASSLPRVKGRPFQAWVSNGNNSPSSKFVHSTGPYIRPDGTVIAANWNDLTDGSLITSIFHDENGAPAAGAGAHVWTATSAAGTPAGPSCDEWSDISAQARIGVIGATTANWTAFSMLDLCTASARLYCFEK